MHADQARCDCRIVYGLVTLFAPGPPVVVSRDWNVNALIRSLRVLTSKCPQNGTVFCMPVSGALSNQLRQATSDPLKLRNATIDILQLFLSRPFDVRDIAVCGNLQ